jgi:hypothetical protein
MDCSGYRSKEIILSFDHHDHFEERDASSAIDRRNPDN